jgi:GR25 family glycosyltransferase involved in LPS biosynthesis
MKVAITSRFLNSYFSGGSPQVACALARTFQLAGHDVTILYPSPDGTDGKEPDWFMDVNSYAAVLPPRKQWSPGMQFDVLIEVVWSLPDNERLTAAKQRILFVHQPPIFHDIESSVYPWNRAIRSFKNLTGVMTYDLYSAQDVRYLEFLSGVQVFQVPFLWNPEALEYFRKETGLPEWKDSAKRVEAMLPPDAPKAASWCARILESNFSNTSHCNIPLNIVTQIRLKGDPIRFSVHNGESTAKNDFFNTNISKNLLLPDISGSMMPRVRLPDLLQEKCVVIAHQRFRPLKTFLLDALYLGIPLIHNCELLTAMGMPYGYVLNQLRDATNAWTQLSSDYLTSSGFFNPQVHHAIKQKLVARFSPHANIMIYTEMLTQINASQPKAVIPSHLSLKSAKKVKELRIHFCELWSEFVPKYNFFMYLFSWIGAKNNIPVILDSETPNLVVYGPLSKGQEKAYPGVSKLFFTGENTSAPNDPDIVLSLGFEYSTNSSYIRLPLWILELNWFNANPDKVVNPRPITMSLATSVDPVLLDKKSKFCAFVATNPVNQNRNAAFQILNGWRNVDSAGRLFCNRPEGPLPAGLGGGGGELLKVDYYKDYKFVITYENSAGHGYTTEKILHAKAAGAVPIYWGDPFVDRDFAPSGFINANQIMKAEDLIAAVQKVADDPALWRSMASVPALSEEKRKFCETTMEYFGKRLFKLIVDADVSVDTWDKAALFGPVYEGAVGTAPPQTAPPTAPTSSPVVTSTNPKVLVTAATEQYISSVLNLLKSLKQVNEDCATIVYVWKNVSDESKQALRAEGATEIRHFPEQFGPWEDFWNPQHFAWKLWLHADMNNRTPANTSILYMDSGVVLVSPISQIWHAIEQDDIFLLDDAEQINARWCHPTFCKTLSVTDAELATNQIWAGCIGFKAKGKYENSVTRLAIGITEKEKNVIVGEKWTPYSQVCMGHRHDQSILSLVTLRAGAPRKSLRDYYCDQAYRTAQQWGTSLYVHRGNFKMLSPFADGIDEAYVINLDRREDRLERFKTTHKTIKNRVYKWKATDGRTLQLTPPLVHCFRNNDFKWKKSVMGCALSHLGLWEKLANDPLAKSYLIMEDDAVLESRWLIRWMTIAKEIPQDADVIYLGGILPPNKSTFQQVIEPVNEYFARVGKNTLFSGPGGAPRRYFHFCNYAYVLTQRGAQKLITLIKDKGIFTSGDHMIVNHGDQLLNIYFTTPLLATCFQENDPIYQKSDFNNFNRVDSFDSDLWNNTECFTEDEVFAVLRTNLQGEKYEVVETPQVPSRSEVPAKQNSDFMAVWNKLLKSAVMKNKTDFKPTLDSMLSMWAAMTPNEFTQHLSYIRMFEQLILGNNQMFMAYKEDIYNKIKTTMKPCNEWDRILAFIAPPAVVPPIKSATTPIFYLKMIKPSFLEEDWLNSVFPAPIEWRALEAFNDLFQTQNPILLYQHIPGDNTLPIVYTKFTQELEAHGKTITILHLSDEYAQDPIDFYRSRSVKHVIRNYIRPNLPLNKTTLLPLGYANGRGSVRAHLSPANPSFTERPYLWSFAGSMDRQGRDKAIITLQKTGSCILYAKESWGSPPKLQASEYAKLLQDSKFIPCFAGFRALESYRLYEALEHGAIPFYVPSDSPNLSVTQDGYTEVLGKHPILAFPSWEKAAELLPLLAQNPAQMEEHRTTLKTWWANKKVDLQKQVNDALTKA